MIVFPIGLTIVGYVLVMKYVLNQTTNSTHSK